MSDSVPFKAIRNAWAKFRTNHPGISQFLVFFVLSNGVTLFQMIALPVFKSIFQHSSLVDISFQIWPVGHNTDGSIFYIFNYPAGPLASGGGGLAYFLSVQITIAIAQVINFFAQRNITFKSDGNIWKSAFWYVVAYVIITIGAAAAQGIYKTPIYNLLMNTWGMGVAGETIADFITMIINAAISFWVFFPIFKLIFRSKKTSPEEGTHKKHE